MKNLEETHNKYKKLGGKKKKRKKSNNKKKDHTRKTQSNKEYTLNIKILGIFFLNLKEFR